MSPRARSQEEDPEEGAEPEQTAEEAQEAWRAAAEKNAEIGKPGQALSGKTKSLQYSGPDDQVVVGIGTLKSGESYDVPVEWAESLVAGSPHWK
jgi:hypothetical protein